MKFCGITRSEDAVHAADLGVDAIGLVFYEKSPRFVTMKQAQDVVKVLPPFICKVGLFVNADPSQVSEVTETVGLDLLQFHGDETADDCAQFKRPFIKAIRMREDLDFEQAQTEFSGARALLLDAYDKALYGGTGQKFDWSRIPASAKLPIILAGGITPDNVEEAITTVRPYAVDVSGGIEASKGIKDKDKMNAFIRGVNSANK